MTLKTNQRVEYRVTSVIDLMPIYNKSVNKEDIRKEFLSIGFFNPLKYIEFLREKKDQSQDLDIFIQNIGKLKLDFSSSNSAVYRTLSVLSQQLEMKFLFTIPLKASSKWHELPTDKEFLYSERVEIYPFYAIYSCVFRKKKSEYYNPHEIQKKSNITGSLSNEFIRQYNKLKKRFKISLLTTIFPKFNEKLTKKIYLVETPLWVIIFAENVSKRELSPLKRTTIKGESGYLDEKIKWEFSSINSTIIFYGENIRNTYKKKMLFSLKMLLILRNHRNKFAAKISDMLIQILRINEIDNSNKKSIDYDNLGNWKKEHYLIFSILLNTFLTVYNNSFYYKSDVEAILGKYYQKHLFSKVTRELKIDESFGSHFKQIVGTIITVNPILLKRMLVSCEKGIFSSERDIIINMTKNTEYLEHPTLVDISEEMLEIIDYLIRKFQKKHESKEYIILREPAFLWPCTSPHDLYKNTSITRHEVYDLNSEKYKRTIKALQSFKILNVKDDPKEGSRKVTICLNLDSPYVKARIGYQLKQLMDYL